MPHCGWGWGVPPHVQTGIPGMCCFSFPPGGIRRRQAGVRTSEHPPSSTTITPSSPEHPPVFTKHRIVTHSAVSVGNAPSEGGDGPGANRWSLS